MPTAGGLPPLSRQATFLANDPYWSKPTHIPGQPVPIPPRNEPPLIPKVSNPITSLSYEPGSSPVPLALGIEAVENEKASSLIQIIRGLKKRRRSSTATIIAVDSNQDNNEPIPFVENDLQ